MGGTLVSPDFRPLGDGSVWWPTFERAISPPAASSSSRRVAIRSAGLRSGSRTPKKHTTSGAGRISSHLVARHGEFAAARSTQQAKGEFILGDASLKGSAVRNRAWDGQFTENLRSRLSKAERVRATDTARQSPSFPPTYRSHRRRAERLDRPVPTRTRNPRAPRIPARVEIVSSGALRTASCDGLLQESLDDLVGAPRSAGGMVRPRALAAPRFSTSSSSSGARPEDRPALRLSQFCRYILPRDGRGRPGPRHRT